MIKSALITLGIILIGFIVYETIHYIWFFCTSRFPNCDDRSIIRGVVRMSWKELRDFYRVKPERWRFQLTGSNQEIKHLYYRAGKGKWYVVIISMPAYLYLLWNYHFGNPMTPAKIEVLESVQEDIDELKEKAQARIDEANKMMTKVMNNLKAGK